MSINILHYCLGFPPYRTGGLTKYVMDLAKKQSTIYQNVYVFWPGKITKDGRIDKKIIKKSNNLFSIELINPLPVSLLEGIKNISAFTKMGDKNFYIQLLKDYQISFVHLHTLIGIHQEFIDACNDLKIPTLYTTHDFFGICPTVNLFMNNKPCNYYKTFEYCKSCNQNALSIENIKKMQSPSYRMIKSTFIVKIIRGYVKNKHAQFKINTVCEKDVTSISNYKFLSDYYSYFFQRIDYFHFNSKQTKRIFDSLNLDLHGNVIPVTNSSISDHRKPISCNKLKMNYLGGNSVSKGIYYLIETLDKLWLKYPNSFELNIYFSSGLKKPYLIEHSAYSHNQLDEVMSNCNMVVIPSLWYETFGFVALESLSYGIPVLMSNRVGAKDHIPDGCIDTFYCENDSIFSSIEKYIRCPNLIENMNKNICLSNLDFDFDNHFKQIEKLYNQVIKMKNVRR